MILLWLMVSGWVSAADLTNTTTLGDLEETFIALAKGSARCEQDPSPQGKTVESVKAVVFDAISEYDPWPDFLGWFHIKTKDEVAARESLLQPGDLWDPVRVWETERNFLADYYVSLARVIPCKSPEAGKVRALVVIKDLWSLRGAISLRVVGSTLEEFALSFGEFNIFGRNKSASVDFGLDQSTYSFGGTITDNRINGSRWVGQLTGSAYVNRITNASEGGDFTLRLTRPLYSLSSEWGYDLALSFFRGTYRLYSVGSLLSAYSQTSYLLEPSVTRSFGRENKANVTFGYRASIKRFTQESGLAVPRSEEAGAIFLRLAAFKASFRRYFEIDTYALPEDLQLGPNLLVELVGSAPALGFSSSYLEPSVTLSYRLAVGDAIFYAGVSGSTRYQPEAPVQGSPWVNRAASLTLRAVSPRLGPVYFVGEGSVRRTDLNQNPTFATLGGATLLRGYPSNYLYGSSLWRANLEMRTRPIRFSSAYAGAALFADVGDTFSGPGGDLGAHVSVGAGARLLFPEFNRRVLRIDVATPLEPLSGVDPANLIVTFGQGF